MTDKKKLVGCDVSSWQYGNYDVDKYIAEECDFICVKLTEGKTYVNPHSAYFIGLCPQDDTPIILYHFCRPDGSTNKMVAETEFFINNVKGIISARPWLTNVGVALDWEGTAEKYGVKILREMATTVHEELGIWPFIYINANYAMKTKNDPDMQYIAKECGLWIAAWKGQLNKTDIGAWPFAAMWQYTNRPFDKDYFFGTKEQLEMYCMTATANPVGPPDANKCECCQCRCSCGGNCVNEP